MGPDLHSEPPGPPPGLRVSPRAQPTQLSCSGLRSSQAGGPTEAGGCKVSPCVVLLFLDSCPGAAEIKDREPGPPPDGNPSSGLAAQGQGVGRVLVLPGSWRPRAACLPLHTASARLLVSLQDTQGTSTSGPSPPSRPASLSPRTVMATGSGFRAYAPHTGSSPFYWPPLLSLDPKLVPE